MEKFTSIDSLLSRIPEDKSGKVLIQIGMSTCGIAAGADKVYKGIEAYLEKKEHLGIDYEIKQVGCLGLCFSEPNVEIIMPDLPPILYGKVDVPFAVKIIEEHIINKKIVNERIYDKPAVDVLKI